MFFDRREYKDTCVARRVMKKKPAFGEFTQTTRGQAFRLTHGMVLPPKA